MKTKIRNWTVLGIMIGIQLLLISLKLDGNFFYNWWTVLIPLWIILLSIIFTFLSLLMVRNIKSPPDRIGSEPMILTDSMIDSLITDVEWLKYYLHKKGNKSVRDRKYASKVCDRVIENLIQQTDATNEI